MMRPRLSWGVGAIVPMLLAAAPAFAEDPPKIDSGDTAWMLTSTALVLLMTIPGLELIGTAPEKAAILSFVLSGVSPEEVAAELDREGIAVRAGHHCAQPLMKRLGVGATSRASFAVHNTRDDVDRLIDGLHRVREVFRLDEAA